MVQINPRQARKAGDPHAHHQQITLTRTNSTTGLIETISQNGVTLTYTYDDNGNITSVSDGTKTTSYEYDAIGQLVRVNDPYVPTANTADTQNGTTWVFTYDQGGNILSKTAYPFTAPEDPVSGTGVTTTYTYGNTAWRDQLTAFNGHGITVIFEWDEDLHWQPHYHIHENHDGVHYLPGQPVPEPYNSLYFGR